MVSPICFELQSRVHYNLYCNRLHYFNAWNIHKFSYRNDKTIESDFGHFVFLNTRSIVRKLLGPLALKNIYCTYLKFFAGKLTELPHIPTCFISCWEKVKEV